MSRRFLLRTAAYTVGFYVMLMMLRGAEFLLSHMPPSVIHIDGAIIGLTYVEQVMVFPRWVLRHLWFSEMTPALVNWVLSFLNCVVWGMIYAAFKTWREPKRSSELPPVINPQDKPR